jgi:hypothetical protein
VSSNDSLCDSLNSTRDKESLSIGEGNSKDRDVTSIANLWSDSSSPSPPLPSPSHPSHSHSTPPKLTTPPSISNKQQQDFPSIDDRLNSLVNSIGIENSENSNDDRSNKSPVGSPNTDNQV